MADTLATLHGLVTERFTDPDGQNDFTKAPFSCGGWFVGTDGHALLAVPDAPTDAPERGHDFICALIDAMPAGEVFDMAALRDFAGPPEPLYRVDHNRRRCPDCGEVHECESREPKRARAGWLMGVGVDRRRLAFLLDGLPGETVQVFSPGEAKPFRLFGDGWRALLMPILNQQHSDPKFPTQPED